MKIQSCHFWVILLVLFNIPTIFAAPPPGISKRTAWTTSQIVGSPDPRPPYKTEQVFPHLRFKEPTMITSDRSINRLFVGENSGKIWSFPLDPECREADLFIDVVKEITNVPAEMHASPRSVYSLTFHPEFPKKPYCYICYILGSTEGKRTVPEGTRISRFTVSQKGAPRCDAASEKIIITWPSGGHNGCTIKFGPDGYLYISAGDGGPASPPDANEAGQDLSNVFSTIMRIDIDQQSEGRAYAIPADNPFVDTKNARGEIWAYGLRNPWKMSFDQKTGDLWVGDVGWELWEMIYRVEKGANYGWSLREGPQVIRTEGRHGPTPIVPPVVSHSHDEAASITGGYVYRGKRLPELEGTYIYGDWETRRMWGLRYDGTKVTYHQEISEPGVRMIAFGEDPNGELYFLDYDNGTIHQLVVNDAPEQAKPFPTKLSQTGLFSKTSKHELAPGVLPFSVNAEQWADGAVAQRMIALPGDSSVLVHDDPTRLRKGTMFRQLMHFPKNGVLAKTISIDMQVGNPATRRRLETQILHFNGIDWRGYTYRWNDRQTDAELVPREGAQQEIEISDPEAVGGKHLLNWQFSGRAQCVRCHNPWTEHKLAFNLSQLNKPHDYGEVVDNQLRTLRHVGILHPTGTKLDDLEAVGRLVDPHDAELSIDSRARSYLHVNCAHCHQANAGGTAYIELRNHIELLKTHTLDARPVQGTFGISDAAIIKPSDPYASVLYYRMSKLGPGRMPRVGSELVDKAGVDLMHAWIRQLPVRAPQQQLIDDLTRLDEASNLRREANRRPRELEQRTAKEARRHGRQATAADRAVAAVQWERQVEQLRLERIVQRREKIAELLSRSGDALMLVQSLERGGMPESVRQQILAAAKNHSQTTVVNLFEQLLPAEQRSRPLGGAVDVAAILSLKGNAKAGAKLFTGDSLSCKNCHRIDQLGNEVGPDLSHIGKTRTATELLDSLLNPSRIIDPKFISSVIVTGEGRVLSGLVVDKSADPIVLIDSQGKKLTIALQDIEEMKTQNKSLMPDLLFRDLTAQQLADLLAYLANKK